MDMKDISEKAKDALPDDDTVTKAADKVQERTPDGADRTVGKAEQWAKDHNKD